MNPGSKADKVRDRGRTFRDCTANVLGHLPARERLNPWFLGRNPEGQDIQRERLGGKLAEAYLLWLVAVRLIAWEQPVILTHLAS